MKKICYALIVLILLSFSVASCDRSINSSKTISLKTTESLAAVITTQENITSDIATKNTSTTKKAITSTKIKTTTASTTKKTEFKPIKSIYTYNQYVGIILNEDKIDLISMKALHFGTDLSKKEKRNPVEENEGYQTVTNITQSKINNFIDKMKKCNIENWQDLYKDEHILDGYQRGITIIYTDNTTKSIYISNAFPSEWDIAKQAFKELTGLNIL